MTTVFVVLAVRWTHPSARPTAARLVGSSAREPVATTESLPPPVRAMPLDAAVATGAPQMLHGDAHHSHRVHGKLPHKPDVAWSLHMDGPVEGQAVVSPDGATIYVATLGGTLWGLDRAGHTRFRTPLGGRSYATPLVAADGTVYVGRDGGAFFAIDPNGRVLWKIETEGDADTAPLLTDDGVIVFAAGSRVYGVRSSGVLAFRFRALGKVFTSPALRALRDGVGHEIVFGSQDHHVYALDAGGLLRWSTDLGHDVDGSPAIGDDGSITVGTDGDEVVHLKGPGDIAWRASVGGMVRGSLSIARDGAVLAGVYGPSPRVVRLGRDGAVLGSFPVRGNGTRETGVYGAPLEDDDGALAFGGQDGQVHVVGQDGRERWAYDARSDVDAPLTLLPDGSLLFETYEGDIVELAPSR